jgi:hypothetical protein
MSYLQTGRLFATAAFAVALLAADPVRADFADNVRQFFARTPQTSHPSIVQVLAAEAGALARGSGTLIHVDGQFGYVISNWHVVRDASGDVIVIFPDGHQSLARVLKTDKDWDLALLLIWRGNSSPRPLSTTAPQPGEALTIAGYGGEGQFRAVRGVFTTYAAPQPDMPYEMFEVSVPARQGDSGGPIVNDRGELAGVLFGAGDGRTTGTQVHRVRSFVNQALQELREQAADVAQTPLNPPIANPPQIEQAPLEQVVTRDGSGWTAEDHVPQQYIPADVLPPPSPSTTGEVADQIPRPPAPQANAFGQPPALEREPPASQREFSSQESTQWLTQQREIPVEEQLAERDFSNRRNSDREFPLRAELGRQPQTPPPASIEAADEHRSAGSGRLPIAAPPYSPPVPAGGITWDQLKSFFAAVGVFALLNTITQTLFVGKSRK